MYCVYVCVRCVVEDFCLLKFETPLTLKLPFDEIYKSAFLFPTDDRRKATATWFSADGKRYVLQDKAKQLIKFTTKDPSNAPLVLCKESMHTDRKLFPFSRQCRWIGTLELFAFKVNDVLVNWLRVGD